jgi:hypothetical protein
MGTIDNLHEEEQKLINAGLALFDSKSLLPSSFMGSTTNAVRTSSRRKKPDGLSGKPSGFSLITS